MALTDNEKFALYRKPSLLHGYKPMHSHNWAEPLDYVATIRPSTADVLNKYYHGLDEDYRPSAAHAIASSWQADAMVRPDKTYLYAWLEHAFWTDYKKLNNSVYSQASNKTSVLSRWLREQPELMKDVADLAARAFQYAGVRNETTGLVKTLLARTIPRQFRRQGLYKKLVALAPMALEDACKHVSEHDSLLLVGDLQCKVAASLPYKWCSLYPNSTFAPTINAALAAMQTLDVYDASMLRVAVGLQEPQESVALPDEAFSP